MIPFSIFRSFAPICIHSVGGRIISNATPGDTKICQKNPNIWITSSIFRKRTFHLRWMMISWNTCTSRSKKTFVRILCGISLTRLTRSNYFISNATEWRCQPMCSNERCYGTKGFYVTAYRLRQSPLFYPNPLAHWNPLKFSWNYCNLLGFF